MARYLRCCEADYRTMLTLTYPGNGDAWLRAKDHLRALAARINRRVRAEESGRPGRGGEAQPFSLFWFVEFQRRGVAHFHCFCTHRLPKDWLARAWYEIVGSGDERHRSAGTRIETIRAGRNGTISYAKKYARKQEQKTLPDMLKDQGFGRFWGIIGSRRVVVAATSLPEGIWNEKTVREAHDHLSNLVEEGRQAGTVRRFVNDRCRVYLVMDRGTENRIRAALLALSEEVRLCLWCVAENPTGRNRGSSP